MPVVQLHTLGAVVLVGSSSVTLRQVRSKSHDTGISVQREWAAGEIEPTFVYLSEANPMLTFETTEIARLLTRTGGDCLAIPDGTALTSVDLYLTQIEKHKRRTAGTTHARERIVSGMLCPRRIVAREVGLATAECQIVADYDGVNDPVVHTDAVALLSGGVDEAFVLGPVKINGTLVESSVSIALDFGKGISAIRSDGEIYPTFAFETQRAPAIQIGSNSIEVQQLLHPLGVAQGVTDSIVYLRKVQKNGTRVADGVAEHIGLTLDDGIVVPMGNSARNNSPYEFNYLIVPSHDLVNATLLINPATAII